MRFVFLFIVDAMFILTELFCAMSIPPLLLNGYFMYSLILVLALYVVFQLDREFHVRYW